MIEQINQLIAQLNVAEAERLTFNKFDNLLNKDGTPLPDWTWHALEKKKFFHINCGTSGAFMVEKETGELFNIKAYGQIDKNKKLKANLGNLKDIKSQYEATILHGKRWNYLR